MILKRALSNYVLQIEKQRAELLRQAGKKALGTHSNCLGTIPGLLVRNLITYINEHVAIKGVMWHTGISSRLWCGRSRVQSPAGPLVEE